jgi:chitinase
MVTIGGWTGGRWFSTDVGNAANRTAFVKTVLNFAEKHHLDGIDFDWEYPGAQGIGCNNISPQDTAHLLSFLQELRGTAVGKKLYLSAAAPIFPWADANGDHTKDVSEFAKVLDHIAVMKYVYVWVTSLHQLTYSPLSYDVWGPWSPYVGPNGPLNDTCAVAANQDGSAVSSVAAWHAAGIPLNQLVLGVPAYGHSFSVARADAYTKPGQLALYAPFNASARPTGDAWDDGGSGPDECGNASGPSGSWDFWGLIQAGWLTSQGTPSKGIDYVFDECAQTASSVHVAPFLETDSRCSPSSTTRPRRLWFHSTMCSRSLPRARTSRTRVSWALRPGRRAATTRTCSSTRSAAHSGSSKRVTLPFHTIRIHYACKSYRTHPII